MYRFKHIGFSDSFNTYVLIVLVFCLKLQVTIGSTTGEKKINRGGFSYTLHTTNNTWDDAEVYCRDVVNGRLAKIANKETAEDIAKMFSPPSIPAWIGANNIASGQYQWAQDSRLVDGIFWAPGEPDLGDPNSCVCLAQSALFYDELCTSTRPFICQKIGEDPTTTIGK
ncbi:C-type lectin lectoxin-Thr1-like [Physella acuta]|uniref:C-type lectin lectoxin-Thr1-like n=1 Tax=Physella acuta TaxID=109671 RepID=UPI0027DAD4F6|nr:C-type lectin lectoxin-Thr1-like [Physella acuta]